MNPVVHFEMAYEDRERAAKFYQTAFGWNVQMLGPDMGNYVVLHTAETDENNMVKTPGTINGGMYKKPEDPMGQAPSVVIAVQNIQEAIEHIKAAGGTVLNEPMDIPGVGAYASFLDTEGNRVSVMQPVMR